MNKAKMNTQRNLSNIVCLYLLDLMKISKENRIFIQAPFHFGTLRSALIVTLTFSKRSNYISVEGGKIINKFTHLSKCNYYKKKNSAYKLGNGDQNRAFVSKTLKVPFLR